MYERRRSSESRALARAAKWMDELIIEQAKSEFLTLFTTFDYGAADSCTALQQYGLLEEVANDAIPVVKKSVVDKTKAELTAAITKINCEGQNLEDLSVQQFIEVICLALPRIDSSLFGMGMEAVRELASAFAELKADMGVVNSISATLVTGVFKEVRMAIRSHSLEGVSFEDFRKLFKEVKWFGRREEMTFSDLKLLETETKNLRELLIDRFHDGYVSRLTKALATEKWCPAEPGKTHIGILSPQAMSNIDPLPFDANLDDPERPFFIDDLSQHLMTDIFPPTFDTDGYDAFQPLLIDVLSRLAMPDVTSIGLDGDAYDTSQPLHILLEVTGHYLEIAAQMAGRSVLPDYMTGKLLAIAECFSSGCSRAVLQSTGTVAVSVRTLSAAGVSFYVRLIPGIKSWLITTEAQPSLVEEYGIKATECLNASYNEIVKNK